MTRLLTASVGLAALALLFWWFGIDELTLAIRRLDPGALLVYLVLLVVVLCGYCLRWKLVTRALGSEVPFGSLVTARLAGDAVGNLVPSAKLAGEPVRIALVHATGTSGAEAAAGVALDRILEVIGNILCALAYLVVFALTQTPDGAEHGAPAVLATVMLAGLALLTLLLVTLYRGKRPLGFLYGGRLQRAWPALSPWVDALRDSEGRLMELMRSYPRIIPIGVLASLAIEAIIIVEYHFLLKAFGLDLHLPTLLLVLLGSGVARTAPTPAGIGALEAGQVTLVGLATGSPSTGFVVGLVLRLHETLCIAAGLMALSYRGVSLARLRSMNAEPGAAV